jgi:hypothetical protein
MNTPPAGKISCGLCNRALIVNDARLDTDARDDMARAELVCECGAVYSAFVRPEDWVFGLERDGAPRLASREEYCETGIGRFRWIVATDCLSAPWRTSIQRIALDDPRPLGVEMESMADFSAWLDALPFGRWRELVKAETRP